MAHPFRQIKMPLWLQLVSEHDALDAAGHRLAIAIPYQLEKAVFISPEPLFTIAAIGHPYGNAGLGSALGKPI